MTQEDQPIIISTPKGRMEDTAAEGERDLNRLSRRFSGKGITFFDFNWISKLLRLDKAAKVLGDHIASEHGRRLPRG